MRVVWRPTRHLDTQLTAVSLGVCNPLLIFGQRGAVQGSLRHHGIVGVESFFSSASQEIKRPRITSLLRVLVTSPLRLSASPPPSPLFSSLFPLPSSPLPSS